MISKVAGTAAKNIEASALHLKTIDKAANVQCDGRDSLQSGMSQFGPANHKLIIIRVVEAL